MQTRNIKVGTKFKHMKEEWICTSNDGFMIENADNKQFEGLRDFMNEHPDNKDAVIVMDGNIEDIVRQIA